MVIVNASFSEYCETLRWARDEWPMIRDMTSLPGNMPADARYFLSDDGKSGFGVTVSGEIVGLFSVAKGRGDHLVAGAIQAGGTRLDCFDGYLPTLYGRHGFREVKREDNWTPGAPDVVYMALAGA